MPDYDSMLTIEQTAKALKTSVEKVRTMIKRREIKSYHKFPETLIDVETVNRSAGRTVAKVTDG